MCEYGRVVLVGHSQGGLVIQCFLANMVKRGRAEELARVRRVVLFACPNTGSQFAESIRLGLAWLGNVLPSFLGNVLAHPQEKALRPYADAIAPNRSIVMNQVFRAREFNTSNCPIPIVACAGTEDAIVTRASALDTFPNTRVLSGDHCSIVRADTPTHEGYEALRQELELAWAEPIPSRAATLGPRTFVVGGKSFLEASILCEMFAQLVESADDRLTVTRAYNCGETGSLLHGLVIGDVDLYAEYTGTLLADILKVDLQRVNDPSLHTTGGLNAQLDKHPAYAKLRAGDLIGFNNSYVMVMLRARAESLGIRSISDLQRRSEALRIRAHSRFYKRPDCLPGVIATYGSFSFAAHDSGDHAQHYDTLLLGYCDVVVGYTTDAQVLDPGDSFLVLEDDRSHFGKYYAFPLFSEAARQKLPELPRVLGWLDRRIDDRKMSQLLCEARAIDLDREEFNLNHERKLRELVRTFLERERYVPLAASAGA